MNYRYFLLFAAFLSSSSAQTISFLRPVSTGVSSPEEIFAGIVAVDFNGDGKPDIATIMPGFTPPPYALPAYSLIESLGNGDGTFQPAQTVAQLPVGLIGSGLAAGDFNGDGKLDLVLEQYTTTGTRYSVLVYFSNGDGTFGAPISTSLSGLPDQLVVANFNSDGRPDIAVGTYVLLGNGDGTFQMAPALNGEAYLSADFNHDGKPDLLLDIGMQQFAVALGNGDGTFGPNLPVAIPGLEVNIVAGDLNGDGSTDLAIALVNQDEVLGYKGPLAPSRYSKAKATAPSNPLS